MSWNEEAASKALGEGCPVADALAIGLPYAAALLRLARRWVRDPDRAQDVVQETWIAVQQAAAEFEEEARPYTIDELRDALYNAVRVRARVTLRSDEARAEREAAWWDTTTHGI